jgi:8-oxo-dGTP pyrophosphatase MutT (NUDIX family)
VLIYLVPGAGEKGHGGAPEAVPQFPVILRPEHDTNHAGQIALPGGQREDNEVFPAGTAVRETCEELGICREGVRIAGVLTPLFISVSNFSVVPVVGWGDTVPELQPDPTEVAAAFFVDADELLAPPVYGKFSVPGGVRRAPYFPFREGRIWGATAMMLNEFAVLHRRVRGDQAQPGGP